ncbi:hypothetical protein LBBP_03622 [Leptospira borgpetersenii serovar Ballum]|uniref:Uncharacterized protein n=1 Tax=Leptospira borgpetersenii serovar Ballum TaxID=280505 RepID=A0A0S2IVW3_LEPBO|nr:hypothetical protein LBBP_03622 [Leptospira borgpetersenii serovar Ballum]
MGVPTKRFENRKRSFCYAKNAVVITIFLFLAFPIFYTV